MANDIMLSKKYIQMIKHKAARFANWNPANPLLPGDYGDIDPATGEFMRFGNIYNDPDVLKAYPILGTPEGQPTVGGKDEKMIVCSACSEAKEFSVDGSATLGSLIDCEMKLEFEMHAKHRGAVLVMHRPRTHLFPPAIDMRELAKLRQLEKLQLVTEAISCEGYVMCLTDKDQRSFKVALISELPTPIPTVGAGGSVKARWWTDKVAGLLRQGYDEKAGYVTLVRLQLLSRGWREWFFGMTRRDSPPPEPKTIEEIWVEDSLPWREIDDDGQEDIFEDTVFDD